MRRPVKSARRKAWRDGRLVDGARLIPEDTALALTYNGGTYAVMMGTPQDLPDFAIGFSLSEGIVQSADEIETLDIVELDDGIELIALQHFCKFGGCGEDNFVLQAPRQRHSIEITDRPDAKRREGLVEQAFPLLIGRALFVKHAPGNLFRGFPRGHA